MLFAVAIFCGLGESPFGRLIRLLGSLGNAVNRSARWKGLARGH